MKYNNDNKRIIQEREIGKVFAEYEDKLVVIDGENKKEREYLIPRPNFIVMVIIKFILIFLETL